MSRTISIAALMAGVALLAMPANAQMGASGGGMTNNRGAAPSGTMPPSGSMGSQGNMQGNMGSPDNMQGNMGAQGNMGMQGGGMMRGEAGERQITECLNMAAAQQRPLSSCRR